MAYNKKTWVPNELIASEALNNMEDGIAKNSNDIQNVAGNLAAPYVEKVYVRGAMVQVGGIVYRAMDAIDPAESFNPEHWERVYLGELISLLAEQIITLDGHTLVIGGIS
jgi:hypothetical protein